ncbi:MAG: signal peptidase I [Angustibacter sp.]
MDTTSPGAGASATSPLPEPIDDLAQQPSPAKPRRGGWWRDTVVMVAVALGVTLVVRALAFQPFVIPSGSMEPTLQVGDRVLVSKLSYRFGDIERGDIIVFDGRNSFVSGAEESPAEGPLARAARAVGSFTGVSSAERDFTKRVIGLPGDRVSCCDSAGGVTVNGQAVPEPYLYPGDVPSAMPFDVVVPEGRLWVMGDHRSNSADSRAHLGDPGGGTVPMDRVIGKVVLRFWPLDRVDQVADEQQGAS